VGWRILQEAERMKKLLSIAMVLGLAGAATAEDGELKDATEILKKADAASKAVKSVKYNASAKARGDGPSQMPATDGTVTLLWVGDDDASNKFRIAGKGSMPNSAEPIEFDMGGDGETFFLIDPANKIAYEDIDPAVVGRAGRIGRTLVMREYTHPNPFSDELNGDKQELQGVVKVGDHDCYKIHVVYKNAAAEAIWYFSTKDFLPRRVERIFGNGGSDFIVTDLVVDPEITDDTFKLVLPEGFTKSDDFAP
jgi:outer membrane lipoprotein-sorting protein